MIEALGYAIGLIFLVYLGIVVLFIIGIMCVVVGVVKCLKSDFLTPCTKEAKKHMKKVEKEKGKWKTK